MQLLSLSASLFTFDIHLNISCARAIGFPAQRLSWRPTNWNQAAFNFCVICIKLCLYLGLRSASLCRAFVYNFRSMSSVEVELFPATKSAKGSTTLTWVCFMHLNSKKRQNQVFINNYVIPPAHSDLKGCSCLGTKEITIIDFFTMYVCLGILIFVVIRDFKLRTSD